MAIFVLFSLDSTFGIRTIVHVGIRLFRIGGKVGPSRYS